MTEAQIGKFYRENTGKRAIEYEIGPEFNLFFVTMLKLLLPGRSSEVLPE